MPSRQRRVVAATIDLRFPFPRCASTMGATGTNATEGGDMSTIDTTQVLLAPGEGELIEVAGNRIRIIVASATQLVCDYSAAPHFAGPPLHVHPGFDETYLVLEGRLQVTVGGERRELEPGAAAYVERLGAAHFRQPERRASALSLDLLPGWIRGVLPGVGGRGSRGDRRGFGAFRLRGRGVRRSLAGRRVTHSARPKMSVSERRATLPRKAVRTCTAKVVPAFVVVAYKHLPRFAAHDLPGGNRWQPEP